MMIERSTTKKKTKIKKKRGKKERKKGKKIYDGYRFHRIQTETVITGRFTYARCVPLFLARPPAKYSHQDLPQTIKEDVRRASRAPEIDLLISPRDNIKRRYTCIYHESVREFTKEKKK